MNGDILTINAGSSSIKFSIFSCQGTDSEPLRTFGGQIQDIGEARARFKASATDGTGSMETVIDASGAATVTHAQALSRLLDCLEQRESGQRLLAVGHRIVHGGPVYFQPQVIDAALYRELEALIPLAPLHQPHNLAAVAALRESNPELPQIACFDTAFHHHQPRVAQEFALPERYWDEGVRHYGFHGLSYEYIASRLPALLGDQANGRVVVAHLGNGASMCALRELRCITTTMGFTPLDGLPMGTRCGALDPGVVLYLQQHHGMSVAEVSDFLYHHTGLLGVSGISNDLRTLLASDQVSARRAIDLFVYHILRQLGSLAAALGGLDALVFTGGIGEHAGLIRERVCVQAGWLGITLDPEANQANGPRISRDNSQVSAWVIPTNEELVIARHTLALLN